MLNFPVAGGTSGHFLGAALATVLLGPWLACLVLAVVLTTQSFVFADGGVSALGANIVDMGVLGALATGGLMLLARRVLPRRRGVLLAVAGAGAWLAVMAGAAGTALCLALSGTVPLGTVLPAMLGVHLVIGVGEALITVAAVSALMATRPDLIGALGARRARRRPRPPAADRSLTMRRFTLAALAVAVVLGVALSPFASSSPDGLEKVAADRGFLDRGRLATVQEDAPVPGLRVPRRARPAPRDRARRPGRHARRVRPRRRVAARRAPPAADRAGVMSGLHALESAGLAGDPASPVHRLDARAKLLGLAGLTLVAATAPAGTWPLLGGLRGAARGGGARRPRAGPRRVAARARRAPARAARRRVGAVPAPRRRRRTGSGR